MQQNLRGPSVVGFFILCFFRNTEDLVTGGKVSSKTFEGDPRFQIRGKPQHCIRVETERDRKVVS